MASQREGCIHPYVFMHILMCLNLLSLWVNVIKVPMYYFHILLLYARKNLKTRISKPSTLWYTWAVLVDSRDREVIYETLKGLFNNLILIRYLFNICFFYRHSLREVLDAPNVMNIIKDTKAAQEVATKPIAIVLFYLFLVFV